MNDMQASSGETGLEIAPVEGKLGVMLVGLGAVSTTFIAGVESFRRGLSRPIGSITQMSTIRLGKRTDARSPLVKDFVPLAALEDLEFAAWDPIPDDAYESAKTCGVLKPEDVEPLADFLRSIRPMPAVFDKRYVKKLDGTNVKKAGNKLELAEQLREDIRRFKQEKGCDRLVMVWAASTEVFMEPSEVHATVDSRRCCSLPTRRACRFAGRISRRARR
jgi:myo-inositol-1-phosphate synthase